MRRAGPIALLLVVAAAGCRPTFPLPYTAGMLAADNSGPALVHFLAQRDASASVCDPRNAGPHLTDPGDEVWDELVDGLVDGRVGPKAFGGCVDHLFKGVPPARAASLLDRMGVAYRKLLKDGDLEKQPPLARRLDVLERLYRERPAELQPHRAVMADLMADLAQALERGALGAVARRHGEELRTVWDVEHGRWKGRRVSVAVLDELARAGEEKRIALFAARLSERALRDEARRRLIRLRIARSPFAELRGNPDTVEDMVMREGRYPISPADYPPLSGEADLAKMPMRGVLVRQNLSQQTITLLGYSGDRPGVSVLPDLPLRGAPWVTLRGLSQPVTFCSTTRDDDPTPCLPAEAVVLKNPMAYLDSDGAFHFMEHAQAADAVRLTRGGSEFLLPIHVGGKYLLSLHWGIWYETPRDLVLDGGAPGAPGPNLGVGVHNLNPDRLVYTVSGASAAPLYAVVEMAEADRFHVISRGGDGPSGQPGHPGHPGRRGRDGASASCPAMPGQDGEPGGHGTHGGPGGPGGPGGDGGDIRVEVQCADNCEQVTALLGATVLSQGGAPGPGGIGGSGGPGGSGGSGGSGTSCYRDGQSYSLPSGSSGPSGMSGYSGSNGPPGPPGNPGRVSFRVAR